MPNIKKHNFNLNDEKNLSQKDIHNNVENIKKDIFVIRENTAKEVSILDGKIHNLETQLAALKNDTKDIKKEFYKKNAFIKTMFQKYYIKNIFVLIIVPPFITTIFVGIVLYIIAKT
ncbi:DUF4094 domain-containing protein [Borreliella afzelii]|uniref:Uncharacterized protein n=1 Tax=Borreliella afzelii TaxID=29518 RepID=A0AB34Z3Y1_BORAF|nr:hypothetical protein [Borreliella afzelii]